ncbi:MAG: hypothetical protein AVDCRST_MAG13-3914 [uncultured Solirubrobacteraceae bacterium]|uniref:Uncharacterized protein n=1 Tax=uncultured Solirubrobacteraceae bacterium TaxID=1162706 RepID=A0A6J4TPH5_9ACTN|nr:MAG: hypothetical protein AVDCRST_MAG13-3914 [uncultured Solirubrobacteraceae bacterium]
MLDGWRVTLEAAIRDKAERSERHGYEREPLLLEARTIRPGIPARASRLVVLAV